MPIRGEEAYVYPHPQESNKIIKVYNPINDKLDPYESYIKQQATNEFEMGRYLHPQGFPVPIMYELQLGERSASIVMQRINGIRVDRLEGALALEARKLQEQEEIRLVVAGIYPWCCYENNAIYEPATEKVVLIDLGGWTHINPDSIRYELEQIAKRGGHIL